MSLPWFVTDELHIQWEVVLESETRNLSAFVDAALAKHDVPPISAAETATDLQVGT